jgi:hypothetical protein
MEFIEKLITNHYCLLPKKLYLCTIITNYNIMNKIHILLAFILWGFALMTNAQNLYRSYPSTNVQTPTTAISIVHSNGYVYFFQADGNGKLSATEIDPLSMNPTGNANYFDIFQQNIFNLNGGFEDASGNFVLFGCLIFSNHSKPAFIVMPYNFSSCDVYFDLNTNGEYTAGCDGFAQNLGEVYMFVNHRKLTAVDVAFPTHPHHFELGNENPVDYYTDISWDSIHDKFIATGVASNTTLGNKDPFVEVFELINGTYIIPFAVYRVVNQTYTMSNERKPLHIQLDSSNLILYYDLRHNETLYTRDVIWLTRIKNFWNVNTAMVDESWFYELPSTKLSAKDMIYDPYNNRLNFLGYLNKCKEGLIQLLAQVDPYSLSSGIEIGQLGATFSGASCSNDQPPYVDIAYNDLEMFNLALNFKNPCNPVLIAGIDKDVDNIQSILTETYDISLSSCDKPMWHEDRRADPVLKPYDIDIINPSDTLQHILPSFLPDPVSVTVLCDEIEACSHQYGGKVLQRFLTNRHVTASIFIETNYNFVCEGFVGEIQYFLYDITGKLLLHGITRNSEQNSLKVSKGIYVLKAVDAKSKQVIKKVVVL